jgi:hypothetical protein
MDVEIGEISSTVRLTDRELPSVEKIVRLVLAALAQQRAIEQGAIEERRVGTGVRDALERKE